MSLFDNMLKDSESLFLNAIALDYDFLPKLIPYREMEQKRIASAIRPLFQTRNGTNVLITGTPGIGKTAACKNILNELEEETDEIIPLYINCWQKNTTYKIFVELCHLLDYRFIHNKKTDEIFDALKRMLNKKCVVFIFDEIDKAEDFDFLYSILEEIYRKSIILVTNYKNWINDLDERIKSRLVPELIEFKGYNGEEIKGILQERKRIAFVPNIWDNAAFDKVVDKTSSLGDVRTGLYLLKETGNAAENRSSKNVTSEDVNIALGKMDEFTQKQVDTLSDEDKMVIELIKTNPSIRMGELFKIYEIKGGKGVYKTFQRKISKLASDNFIDAKLTQGKEGTSKILTLKSFS